MHVIQLLFDVGILDEDIVAHFWQRGYGLISLFKWMLKGVFLGRETCLWYIFIVS